MCQVLGFSQLPCESHMKLGAGEDYQLQFIEPGDQRFEPEHAFSTDMWGQLLGELSLKLCLPGFKTIPLRWTRLPLG